MGRSGIPAPLTAGCVTDDENGDVRTKAMEIIEQQRAIEEEGEPAAEK